MSKQTIILQHNAYERFKRELRAAKTYHGLSFRDLEKSVNLSKSRIQELFKEPDLMSLAQLRAFCNVLHISPASFLEAYGFEVKQN